VARVFISHSSADDVIAATLHGWLVAAGHDVFLDRDLRDGIAVGDAWERRLHERLRWADAVVCVVTTAYRASTWCSAEVGIARSRGSVLLPIRAEPGAAHPLLTSLQWSNLADGRARAQLREALDLIDRAGGRGWSDGRSPYPGLRPFELDLRGAFCGRDDDIAELTALLRSPADRSAVLVVGPSGCGKSSLVRAGLAPVMAEEPGWSVLSPILPGGHPVAALARELAAAAREVELTWTPAQVRERLDREPLADVADELLLAAPGRRRTTLLVLVDQMEELVTQTPADERSAFVALLNGAPIQVVGTMRPEFLSGFLADPALAGLATHMYTLRPLGRENLRAVVQRPAELAGLHISEDLVARLVDDTGSGAALPLLAFTLAQLAENAGRGDELSSARYEQLGGVQGALIRQADAALAEAMAAGGRHEDDVFGALLRLVTVDEQGRPTRWRVARGDLSGPALAELDTFVTRRLLVTDSDGDLPVIEVAHEEFLTAWPPLATAITDRATGLRARRDVELAAAEWTAGGRASDKLWEGGQLAAAVNATGVDRRRPSVEVGPTAAEFLRASRRRDTRRRRRLVSVLSVLLVAALVGAGIAFVQGVSARRQLATATARQLLTQADAVRYSDPRTALRLGIAARRIDDSAESRTWLDSVLSQTSFAGTLPGSGEDFDGVTSLAFSPDGRVLAACHCLAGLGVVLWDLAASGGPRQFGDPLTVDGYIGTMRFSSNGQYLLGAGGGSIVGWDVTDPTRPRPLGDRGAGTPSPDNTQAFSEAGTLLATSNDGSPVQLWDVADPASPRRPAALLAGQIGTVQALAFSRDTRMLAVVSRSRRPLTLWDIADPKRPLLLAQPPVEAPVDATSAAFSADGRLLAVGEHHAGARLWDVADRRHPHLVAGPLAGTASDDVSFSPKSTKRLLTFNFVRGETALWNVEDLTAVHQLIDPYNALSAMTGGVIAYSPDSQTMARADKRTGSVDLWVRGGRDEPMPIGTPLAGHRGPVLTTRFAPDGATLATGGADGAVQLWNVRDRSHPTRLGPPLAGRSRGIRALAFSPDGRALAVGSAEDSDDASGDGTVVLWNVSDPTRPLRTGEALTGLESQGSLSLGFSADGATLVVDATPPILVDVRDLAAPHKVAELPGEQIVDIGTTQDGQTIAVLLGTRSGATDAPVPPGVRLWDLTDPRAMHQIGPALTGHSSNVYYAALSARGDRLVTADHDLRVQERPTAIVWDLTDAEHPVQHGPPLEPSPGYFDIALDPDGDLLAVGETLGMATLWSLDDPARVRPLALPMLGPGDNINDLTFAPDGTALALAGADGQTVLWDLRPLRTLRAHALEQACQVTGGGLDRGEWLRYLPNRHYEETCPVA
jgi:WD40 repeat protein